MFKVAVVGSGYIAQNHLAALKKLEGVELAALVARNPVTGPKSAEPYGIPCFPTMKEAVEKAGVNVMVITLPTSSWPNRCRIRFACSFRASMLRNSGVFLSNASPE